MNPPAALVGTATLNYQTNKANNLTTVAEVGADGRFTIRSTAAVDVVIDVVGYHTSPSGSEGSIFQPLTPARVTKTISGEGTCLPAPCNRMTAGETVRYRVTGVGGVPAAGVDAVVLDVSIEAPSAAGFAKVIPTGGTNLAEAAATLHYSADQTVNDVVVAQLDAEGYVTIFTQQAADVIIDVSGWYRPLTGTWTYRHDGDGLRVAKVAPQGQTTNYTWDHTSGLPLLLAETTGGQTTRWTYGPGGQPVSQHNPDGSVVFFHQDQIGSTRLLTSTTGTVAATYTYDPYGRQTSKTGTAATPLGYTGQYTDTETGFQYLRARFYDPTTGQFLTRDPAVAMTMQPYAYAGNDPVNWSDPLGLWPWDGKCVTLFDDNCVSIADQHPEVTQGVVDFASGVLEVNPITATTNALGLSDTSQRANTSSNWYTAGWVSMTAVDVLLPVSATRQAFGRPGLNVAGDCWLRLHVDDAVHRVDDSTLIGRHLQLDTWTKGAPGSNRSWRWELPDWWPGG